MVMVISRTPVRMSFAGGGSDLKEYYKHRPGAVVSTAINKYVYIVVNKRFSPKLRISYSKVEEVSHPDDVEHHLVREALRLAAVPSHAEVAYISDLLPAHEGSGLGSSSSITVGTLHALHAFTGKHAPAELLADQACLIEIDRLGNPIGKQDQYAAAFGGLNFIQFFPDETVRVERIIMAKEARQKLQQNLIAFHTGVNTRSDVVLNEQKRKTVDNLAVLDAMVGLAHKLKTVLEEGDIDQFGRILHEGWLLKKKLASNMSNSMIDTYYAKALAAGATGGKILGSGGGGFLLFYCPQEKQDAVRAALSDLRELSFSFEPEGSKIIYVGGHGEG